jgi:hypothetical protein
MLKYLSRNYPLINKFLDNLPKRMDFKSTTPKLGRWSLDHDDKSLKKVDLTNEDHCGVCNTMREDYLDKENTKEQKKVKN